MTGHEGRQRDPAFVEGCVREVDAGFSAAWTLRPDASYEAAGADEVCAEAPRHASPWSPTPVAPEGLAPGRGSAFQRRRGPPLKTDTPRGFSAGAPPPCLA
jgi:hypothetical protein